MILAPLAATLVQMAISRTREDSADRGGAEICGQSLWLARALRKIEQLARGAVNEPAERNPASAHLFIVNPLHMGGVDSLFRTHPPTADRVRRLRELAPRARPPARAGGIPGPEPARPPAGGPASVRDPARCGLERVRGGGSAPDGRG